jgi:hypothetical protein
MQRILSPVCYSKAYAMEGCFKASAARRLRFGTLDAHRPMVISIAADARTQEQRPCLRDKVDGSFLKRERMKCVKERKDECKIPNENHEVTSPSSQQRINTRSPKRRDPMIWTYGKGKVFHTPMGHDVGAMLCVGFQTTLTRGTEWAATGSVTLAISGNFPSEVQASVVPKK